MTYCLRAAYFNKVNPKPPTETQLGYYVDGYRRHLALQTLTNIEREFRIEKYGIKGSIDLYDGREPIEVKTTRAISGIPQHYINQLGFYCAIVDSQRGHLIIQRLNNKEMPWEWHTVEWTQDELKELCFNIVHRSSLLKTALTLQKPGILPIVGGGMTWICTNCQHKNECANGG